MGKIVKYDKTPFEMRMSENLQTTENPAPSVRVTQDEDGLIVHGFGEAVSHLYFSQNPEMMLRALHDAIWTGALHLHRAKANKVPNEVIMLMREAGCLLEDMANQADNPLVRYASKPGRGGRRRDPHWDADARRYLALAARARWKLAEEYSVATETPTLKSACQWVWDTVDAHLKKFGGGALNKRLGGEWGDRKAEGAEQKKPKATGGDRVSGWGEAFSRKNDVDYLQQLQKVEQCKSAEKLRLHVEFLLARGFERLVRGTVSVTKRQQKVDNPSSV